MEWLSVVFSTFRPVDNDGGMEGLFTFPPVDDGNPERRFSVFRPLCRVDGSRDVNEWQFSVCTPSCPAYDGAGVEGQLQLISSPFCTMDDGCSMKVCPVDGGDAEPPERRFTVFTLSYLVNDGRGVEWQPSVFKKWATHIRLYYQAANCGGQPLVTTTWSDMRRSSDRDYYRARSAAVRQGIVATSWKDDSNTIIPLMLVFRMIPTAP